MQALKLGSCPSVLPSAQTLQQWLRPDSLLSCCQEPIVILLRNSMPLIQLFSKDTEPFLGLLLSSGLYFPLQGVHGNEFPGSCTYQFPLWWSAGAPCETSDGPATGFARMESLCTHVHMGGLSGACHAPSSSTGRAMGACDGPSLASGHTPVKLPGMETVDLKEKYKLPFQSNSAGSS